MIDITVGAQGRGSVLRVNGRMDSATAPEFERACMEIVASGERLIVLDFAGLHYISSAGLRSLLLVGKALREHGGALRLAGVTGIVGQVLQLSGFDALFPSFGSAEEACA